MLRADMFGAEGDREMRGRAGATDSVGAVDVENVDANEALERTGEGGGACG